MVWKRGFEGSLTGRVTIPAPLLGSSKGSGRAKGLMLSNWFSKRIEDVATDGTLGKTILAVVADCESRLDELLNEEL